MPAAAAAACAKKLAIAMAMAMAAAATAVFLSFGQQKDCRPKRSVVSGVQADIVIVVVLDVVVNFVSRVCQQENDYDYSKRNRRTETERLSKCTHTHTHKSLTHNTGILAADDSVKKQRLETNALEQISFLFLFLFFSFIQFLPFFKAVN